MLLHFEPIFYYKTRQLLYYKTSRFYYKTRQLLQNEPFLLQNAAVITKHAVYYKTGHNTMKHLQNLEVTWSLLPEKI